MVTKWLFDKEKEIPKTIQIIIYSYRSVWWEPWMSFDWHSEWTATCFIIVSIVENHKLIIDVCVSKQNSFEFWIKNSNFWSFDFWSEQLFNKKSELNDVKSLSYDNDWYTYMSEIRTNEFSVSGHIITK